MMMNTKDAKNVVKDLSEKPFVCSEHCIETESGYVITTKEKQKYARNKKRTNADRIRSMTDGELAVYLSELQEITLMRNKQDSVEDSLQYLQAEVKDHSGEVNGMVERNKPLWKERMMNTFLGGRE